MKIFGFDIGYGWSKLTLNTADEVDSFCSVVHLESSSTIEQMIPRAQLNDGPPWVFAIGNNLYVAGPHADECLRSDSRTLNSDYAATDLHYVLFLAGLRQVNEPIIDHVGVGVPVGTAPRIRQFIEEAFTGEHLLSLDGSLSCTVRNVHVFSQGYGAYVEYCFQNLSDQKELIARLKKTALIVDAGFCTLDWLVARGTAEDAAQSGSAICGARPILSEIAKSIAADFACRAPSILEIEAAIIHGTRIRVASLEVEPQKYASAATPIIQQGMAAIQATIRNAQDIHEILLTGGGASFYQKPLQSAFPHHNVIVMPNGRFANAQGYHRLLERKFGRSSA